MSENLFLFRHGDYYEGKHSDLLSDLGKEQAKQIADYIHTYFPNLIGEVALRSTACRRGIDFALIIGDFLESGWGLKTSEALTEGPSEENCQLFLKQIKENQRKGIIGICHQTFPKEFGTYLEKIGILGEFKRKKSLDYGEGYYFNLEKKLYLRIPEINN